MVATQSFSISRRALDVEDYIDIGRRHAGWIAGPTFFGLVISICVAFVLPNEYQSRATMQIQPAHISENMVQSTLANSLNERIQQMETTILSRTELSSIINDPRLLLYKEEQKTRPLEDVIEEMRRNIHIDFVALPGALGKHASAFDIRFNYKDRFKAQQTVTALISKFEEQNQNTQKTDQQTMKDLVGDLLQKAKADLAEASDKLTAFKEGNAGKLPEDVGSNIAREASFTAKIQGVNDQIVRDRQTIAQYEVARDIAKGRLDVLDQDQAAMESLQLTPGSPAAQQNQDLAQMDKAIDNLEFQIQQLRKQYNDKNPTLKQALKALETYQARRADLAAKVQAKAQADAAQAEKDAAKPREMAKTVAGLKYAEQRRNVNESLLNLAAQIKAQNDDIVRLQKERDGYQKESDDINRMLKEGTGIEATYEDLKQAKALAEANYLELQKKNQLAEESGQLIERKAGEVLDVLDNANLPISPIKPNRYLIVGAGFGISVILGLVVAGLQEAKDTSLKNLKDVRAYTNLPVLCSIPLLENTMLVRRKRRLTYLAWASAVLLGAACVSGAVVYYINVTKGGGTT